MQIGNDHECAGILLHHDLSNVVYGSSRNHAEQNLPVPLGVSSLSVKDGNPAVDLLQYSPIDVLPPVRDDIETLGVAHPLHEYINDYPRLYLYGWLFGGGYVLATYLQDLGGGSFYWPQTLAGLAAAIIGLVLFIRFLKEYPLPDEKASSEIS